MASKTQIHELADRILATEAAINEYRNKVDRLTAKDTDTYEDRLELATCRWEVTNLNGVKAGLWAAATIFGAEEKLNTEILKRHGY